MGYYPKRGLPVLSGTPDEARDQVLTRYQLGDGQGLEPLSKEETISLAAFAGALRLGPSIMISGMPLEPTPSATVSRTDNEQTAAISDLNAGRLPSARSMRGLDWLNFLLADVQTGVGPFLAIYLAGYRRNEQRVGIALTIGGIAESCRRRRQAAWWTGSGPSER